MTQRTRVLAVGGTFLGLIVIGLVVGFFLVGGDKATPNASTSPSPTPTDVRGQIEQVYLHYWDVYTDAMLHLDTSHLNEVLADKALQNHIEQVTAQRNKSQPVRIRVEHDYRITLVDQVTASVEDNYINHSVRLDPKTLEPTEQDPNQHVRRSYTLKKVNGVWKVTLVVGFRSGSP